MQAVDRKEAEAWRHKLILMHIFGYAGFGDCAKEALVGYTCGVLIVVSVIVNIVLFGLAVSFYSRRESEPSGLAALNACMTVMMLFETVLRAVASRRRAFTRWMLFEYALALVCISALLTYLVDTEEQDEVLETSILAFRSVAVLLRVGLTLFHMRKYRRARNASVYQQINFDDVSLDGGQDETIITDEEGGVMAYE